jgi:hypothetical protein
METNLLHVEDLNAMITGLRPNDHVVIVRTNLAPLAGSGVLGQTSKVHQLSSRGDLCKCGAV